MQRGGGERKSLKHARQEPARAWAWMRWDGSGTLGVYALGEEEKGLLGEADRFSCRLYSGSPWGSPGPPADRIAIRHAGRGAEKIL